MWAQHWPVAELKKIDREVRKIIAENGGKLGDLTKLRLG